MDLMDIECLKFVILWLNFVYGTYSTFCQKSDQINVAFVLG